MMLEVNVSESESEKNNNTSLSKQLGNVDSPGKRSRSAEICSNRKSNKSVGKK